MNNFVGLSLATAQIEIAPSEVAQTQLAQAQRQSEMRLRKTRLCEVRLCEIAPPTRPPRDLANDKRSPRKKPNTPGEIRAPRVQLWGEMRVLRSREIAENDEKASSEKAVLELTIAREEAFSPSFQAALDMSI